MNGFPYNTSHTQRDKWKLFAYLILDISVTTSLNIDAAIEAKATKNKTQIPALVKKHYRPGASSLYR